MTELEAQAKNLPSTQEVDVLRQTAETNAAAVREIQGLTSEFQTALNDIEGLTNRGITADDGLLARIESMSSLRENLQGKLVNFGEQSGDLGDVVGQLKTALEGSFQRTEVLIQDLIKQQAANLEAKESDFIAREAELRSKLNSDNAAKLQEKNARIQERKNPKSKTQHYSYEWFCCCCYDHYHYHCKTCIIRHPAACQIMTVVEVV